MAITCRKLNGDDGERQYLQPKFTAKTPYHFFKIIIESSLRDGKIKIPMKFLSRVGEEMPTQVKLHVPCGTVWKVEVTKSTNGEVWLQNGWREFAEHFSLSYGHLVVFRYRGDGQFNVIIFDMTASEIDYPYACTHAEASNKREEGTKEETEDSDYKSVEISECAENCRRKRREKSPLRCTKPSKWMRINSAYEKVGVEVNRSCSIGEIRRGMPSAPSSHKSEVKYQRIRPLSPKEISFGKSPAYDSKSPFFRIVLKPSYVYLKNCLLNIPTGFARKYLKDSSGEVHLCVPDGRSWEVRYHLYTSLSKAQFTSNWRAFVADNKLNAGDACTFELIKGSKTSFNVIINRATDEANHGSVSGYQGKCKKLRSETDLQITRQFSCLVSSTPSKISTKHPSFILGVRSCYLTHGFMRIPASFAREYLKHIEAALATLETATGSWSVKLLKNNGDHYILSAGLSAFARENSIQQEDICTFELIKRSDVVFKVSITRCTD